MYYVPPLKLSRYISRFNIVIIIIISKRHWGDLNSGIARGAEVEPGALKMEDRKKTGTEFAGPIFRKCRTGKCRTGKCRTGFRRTISQEQWPYLLWSCVAQCNTSSFLSCMTTLVIRKSLFVFIARFKDHHFGSTWTRPVRTWFLPWAVGVLSAGHPYRWLCTCTSETLQYNELTRLRDMSIVTFNAFVLFFLNVIEWAVAVERRVHECSALLYERLWSFSFHPLSFWSSFFRSKT